MTIALQINFYVIEIDPIILNRSILMN